MDPETAVYVLYIAELWIDDGEQKPEILYAYGLNQRHAFNNFQQWLSPAGWLFAHLENIIPHPEGYRINDDLLLEGVITHDGYQIFQDQLDAIV